jgi:diphthamide biosynthesis protein 7
MVSVPPLHSLILDLPPSCTEFWPLNPQYAVVGTYNLEKEPAIRTNDDEEPEKEALQQEKPQERNGSIILLKVEGDQVLVNILVWFLTSIC